MKPTEKKDTDYFSQQVAEKAHRKLKALSESKQSVWFGLGMFGIIGWTVAVPTLLGAALGIWMDKKHPESFSWTLTCLILGLFIGCLIAWHWITKEHKEMNQKDKKNE
jgi:ATP synthase protein I